MNKNGATLHESSPTKHELDVLDMVRRCLVEERFNKSTGKLTFEVDLQDGGITNKWYGRRMKERECQR
jgi:hypothetical protein